MYFVKTPALIIKLYTGLNWRIPVTDNCVFLTFDDGPDPNSTPFILKTLADNDAKATFFCLGENVEEYPEHFSNINKAGHAVGSHAYTHISGWETENTNYYYNVNKGAQLIGNNLFRPPYGRMKRRQMKFLMRQYSIYMWDVLSGDFDPKVSAEKCYKNVVANYKPGSIIVFHDSVNTLSKLEFCLPRLLQHFKDKGVTMSQISNKREDHYQFDPKSSKFLYG